MYQRVILTVAITSLLSSLAACSPRTAAETQQTIKAFDPSTSDEKAVAAIDEMATALGGTEAWAAVKQVRWELKHKVEDKVTEHFRHAWDIWNGRHRFETKLLGVKTEPDEEPRWLFAMYNLFKRDSGGYVAQLDKPQQKAPSEEVRRVVGQAYQVWLRDAYYLSMFHKLKDPGVKLTYAGERKDFYGTCTDTCLDIMVQFEDSVGKDTYHVLLNKQTKIPEVIEKSINGGKMAMKVLDWQTVNGLKFPTGLKNLGANEVFSFENVSIGEPNDSLYVPPLAG